MSAFCVVNGAFSWATVSCLILARRSRAVEVLREASSVLVTAIVENAVTDHL